MRYFKVYIDLLRMVIVKTQNNYYRNIHCKIINQKYSDHIYKEKVKTTLNFLKSIL